MAITIDQKPISKMMGAGQELVFTVSDAATIASHFNHRYYCDVYVAKGLIADAVKVSTLKTTPNSSGVGIFDVRRAVETELSSDYFIDNASGFSEFQGSSGLYDVPLHYVSECSMAGNSSATFYFKFYIKASTTLRGSISTVSTVQSLNNFYYHSAFSNDEVRSYGGVSGNGFGVPSSLYFMNSNSDNFLTKMPYNIKARANDVGVVGFLTGISHFVSSYTSPHYIGIEFYNSAGASVGSKTLSVTQGTGGQAYNTNTGAGNTIRCYAGVYPANLKQTGDLPSGTSYYTFRAYRIDNSIVSAEYTISIQDECEYETNRLCWLNELGAWDYFNFNVKSVRTTNVSRNSFNSSGADWSGEYYSRPYNRGGKKVYSVSSKDSILLNTEYLTEEEGIWLESLMSSSEVFLIKKGSTWAVGDTAASQGDYSQFVEPVVITNSAMTRKTLLNDKLISHQFTIERSQQNNTYRI
tara:strand:+ start:276 stop:1676 length:1401 start_codon:yes stop_codon:yes gene_type:complete